MPESQNMSAHISARMSVVENAVDRLEKSVNNLAGTMQKYVESQALAPRPIPFKEIILTAAATLTVFGGVLAFLDARASKDFLLAEKDRSILMYRIDQLERQKKN